MFTYVEVNSSGTNRNAYVRFVKEKSIIKYNYRDIISLLYINGEARDLKPYMRVVGFLSDKPEYKWVDYFDDCTLINLLEKTCPEKTHLFLDLLNKMNKSIEEGTYRCSSAMD
jgi:hypothetical protein